jgi:hypothetical protein
MTQILYKEIKTIKQSYSFVILVPQFVDTCSGMPKLQHHYMQESIYHQIRTAYFFNDIKVKVCDDVDISVVWSFRVLHRSGIQSFLSCRDHQPPTVHLVQLDVSESGKSSWYKAADDQTLQHCGYA